MGRRLSLFILSTAWALILTAQRQEYRRKFVAMGSAFEVVVVAGADSAGWATRQIELAENEIRRIEKLISSWDPNSETSRLNASAGGEAIEVDPELYQLIWRGAGIYQMTHGAFDITYASMAGIWDFSPEKANNWPDSALVDSMKQFVDATQIEFYNDNRVRLLQKGMRIGFGGIGKGYAADKAAELLQRNGVMHGVVNASGDIYAWGMDESGDPWRVAVVDPKDKQKIKLWLTADNQAIVTSGDYEKYKLKDGVRYAHIINPKTGYPVTGIMSTTVVAKKAELADALATAIFVLGKDKGLALINSLDGIECIIIDDNGKIWYSKNISQKGN